MVVVGLVGAALVALFVGGSGKVTWDKFNVDTSGRSHLISGGAELFSHRPLWGLRIGAPSRMAYTNHSEDRKKAPVTISHTEPITVASEQGLIGLAAYLALVVVSLWTMAAGLPGALPRSGSDVRLHRPRRDLWPPSSPSWSTRWPTPSSSRTRSPAALMAIGASLAAARGGAPDRTVPTATVPDAA